MAGRSRTLDLGSILADAGRPAQGDDDPATGLLLDAAAELMATYGLRRWTMEDVADRSGLGRATVYRRFASREALVRSTLEREARRFFGAVTDAVEPVQGIEEKVVAGFLVGLRMARRSVLPSLVQHDPGAALSLATSASLLASGRQALADGYEGLIGVRLRGRARRRVEAVAEALIRLGLSFVLAPGSVIDIDDERAAHQTLRALIGPIVAGT